MPEFVLTGANGYHPNQPLFGDGVSDTVLAGENAIRDEVEWRAFGDILDLSETRSDSALAYTATLVSGNANVTLSSGANALTTMRARQHFLIDGELFLIFSITDDEHVVVRPTPDRSASTCTIKPVPVINALHYKRGTQTAGNSTYYGDAIFTVGNGAVRVNGAALTSGITASETLQVSYENGASSHSAGFTEASAPTAVDGTAGSKAMPVGVYPVVLIRKRSGFSGQGNPSARTYVTTTVIGNRLQVTLPAFATSEGQDAWIVGVPRRADVLAGVEVTKLAMWEYPAEFTSASTDVQIEYYDEELLYQVSYDNDPPPKALYCGSLNGFMILASTDGDVKNGVSSTPGAFIAAAKPNNPEAYSPFGRARTPNSELINGMHISQYVAFLLTDNSLAVASLSGNQTTPFVIRQEWSYGFLHQGNGVVIEDRFYGFAGQNLYRTVGANRDSLQATNEFSIPIKNDLRDLSQARVFLGSDIEKNHFVVFHSCAEKRSNYWVTKAWTYNTQTQKWSVPVILKLSGADCIVTSCATVENILVFTCSNGKTYQWDRGTATQAGYLLFPFIGAGSNRPAIVGRFTITGNLDGKPELYKNLSLTNAKAGTSPAARKATVLTSSGAAQTYPTWRPAINCYNAALRLNFSAMAARTPLLTGVIAEALIAEGFAR